MDNAQILSWVVGAIGISGFLLAGRKVWWSWYVNIVCQVFWVLYAIASSTPAFLITAGFYTAVFSYNAWKWTKERHKAPSGALNIEPDSNLVAHARNELRRLGENEATIEQILKVVRAFSRMGHSGASAAFFTPMLMKLLQFEPLSPLTNDPAEWQYHGEEIWGDPKGIWQNRRDGRMFSDDGGLTYTNVDERKLDPQPVYASKVTHSDFQEETV